MPTLPDKTALGAAPIDNPGRAVVQLPKDTLDPGAMAASVLGDGIRGIAAGIKKKSQEADDYEVQTALVDFDLQQEKRLDDAKRAAPPEAKDFTRTYRGGYDQSAREFMTRVPDRLKPKLDEILVRRGAAFEKRAYDFELAERDRYHIDDVTTRLNDIYNDSTGAPDRHADNAQRGVALIRSSRLPARTKLKAEREFLDKNEEFAIRALADRYAAEGRDVSELIEQLKKVPRGSWRRDPVSVEGTEEDFRGQNGAPASIRFNNPGAMYPGPSSKKFGAIGTEIIGGGHKIAVFPDAVTGAAAQFDLLVNSQKYQGRKLSDAIRTWSGGNSPGTYLEVIRRETGLEPDTVLTKELLADPKIAIPLAKAMAVQEAGKPYPLSDAGWQRAHQMALGGVGSKPPATMDALAREADAMRRGTPLGEQPDGQIERIDLPPPNAANPETPKDGTLAPTSVDATDEPFEADDAPYRNLSPTTRRRLINVLRNTSRAQITTQITDDIERLRLGKPPKAGPDGKTSLDRARTTLPPIQFRKVQEQWTEADLEYRAISPLRSLPREQMYDHTVGILQQAERDEESLRAARRVQQKAEREVEKIIKLRETDPVRSVEGFVGEETDERRPPLPNTTAAMRVIQQNRAPEVMIGPYGKPMQGQARNRLSPQQQWQMLFEARLKDQEAIMPDEPEKHRIISRREAEKFLKLPKDGKGLDDRMFRQRLAEAADRAEREFGPAFAKRVMQEAIAFQLPGGNEDHKQMQAQILRRMIQGEPILGEDVTRLRRLDDLRRSGLNIGSDALTNIDRAGRPFEIPTAPLGDTGRPAIGQQFQPPSARQQQWLTQNPDGWQIFDEKFGRGSAARILGGNPDVTWRPENEKLKKPAKK